VAIMKKTGKAIHQSIDSSYKRCPECFTKLPLNATKCISCNQKVHDVGKHGIAKKPVNLVGYSSAIILWIALGVYIWWAFFKN
jgi:hypothetical protein